MRETMRPPSEQAPARRTPKEVEELKREWAYDPVWDIEQTEGFEAHREELAAYHAEKRREWDEQRTARLARKADELGCPGNLALARYVLGLEGRIDALETRVRGVIES